MRVFVTGAAGFIGSHVVEALLKAQHEVFGYDNFTTGSENNIDPKWHSQGFEMWQGDIRSRYALERAMEGFRPEAVIHLAAQAAISSSIRNPAVDLEINGIGTINVLQIAKDVDVKSFVLASTAAVYDENEQYVNSINENFPTRPSSPYGVSKLAAEGYVRSMANFPYILRFGNVYGPRQVPIESNQLIARLIRHLEHGDDFWVNGDGKQRRDFVYVTDVVSAIIACAIGKYRPGTYNIANAKPISVNDVVRIAQRRYGIEGYPWKHTSEMDPRYDVCLNNEKAFNHLGWRPAFDIISGVNRTIDWYKENPK